MQPVAVQEEIQQMQENKLSPGNSISKTIIDFFMSISIFDAINMEELKVIAKHMNIITLNAGEILFEESDPARYICFIMDGTLDVIKRPEADKLVVLETLHQGQSIGEISVIDDLPRSATIQANTATTLFVLSKSAFDFILEKHSRIGVKLLKGISRLVCYNLRKTSNRLVDYLLPLQ